MQSFTISVRSLSNDRVVIVVLLLTSLLSAFLFKSSMLIGWDPVQFALALEHYNIALHQPHPPGYILWVVTLKLLSPFLGVNVASILLNVIFEWLTAYIMYYMLHKIFKVKRTLSLTVTLSWLMNPMTLYYRATAENYASGTFFAIAILYFTLSFLKDSIYWKIIIASFLLGFSGGFRIEIPLFLPPL